MRISREWATPVAIGAFALMSVTGVLMFFHRDFGLNKLAHEWLGWVMVAGAAAHVAANWTAFKRYFVSSGVARAIVGVFLVVLAASFVRPPGGGRVSPSTMAMKAVARAPLSAVAPIAGKPADRLLADLAKAGLVLPNEEASLESAVGQDRELQGKAMRIIFGG